MDELSRIPPYLWLILITALLIQGSWIFQDAAKKGENKWLWGIFGLLNIPSSLLVYLLATRVVLRPSPCPHCRRNVRGSSAYCPHCGGKIGGKE